MLDSQQLSEPQLKASKRIHRPNAISIPSSLLEDQQIFEAQILVFRTWRLSFDQIRKNNLNAAEVLSLTSILDQQGHQKTLLYEDNKQEGQSNHRFWHFIGILFDHYHKVGSVFEMHQLFQISTQK